MEEVRALTTGNALINLIKVSVPTSVGFIFQMVYDLVNIAWMGMISPEAIAGVTIFVTILWTVDVLNQIIGVSSIALISQNFGKGDMDKTAIVIERTLSFKAFVGVIASIILFIIIKPLIGFFTNDPKVIEAALAFGYIRLFFIPIMFSFFSLNTAFRCMGEAKKPMQIMIFSAIMNLILDPILMFDKVPGTNIPGLGLGVFGAALTTVISVLLAFVIQFIVMLRYEHVKIKINRLLKLNWEIDKKLLTIGFPSGVEALSRNLVNIFTLKFIAIYGTAAVAAMGIGHRIFGFAFMVLVGLSMGGSSIAGQCIGVNDVDRAKSTAKLAAYIGAGWMGLFSVLTLIFPEAIMGIFASSKEVIDVGIPMLQLGGVGLIAVGVMMGLGSIFSAAGYNIPFLIASIIGRWIVQIPALFVTVSVFHMSLIYVWIIVLLAEVVETAVVVYYFNSEKWVQVKAVC